MACITKKHRLQLKPTLQMSQSIAFENRYLMVLIPFHYCRWKVFSNLEIEKLIRIRSINFKKLKLGWVFDMIMAFQYKKSHKNIKQCKYIIVNLASWLTNDLLKKSFVDRIVIVSHWHLIFSIKPRGNWINWQFRFFNKDFSKKFSEASSQLFSLGFLKSCKTWNKSTF